jgi:hypothetical protein
MASLPVAILAAHFPACLGLANLPIGRVRVLHASKLQWSSDSARVKSPNFKPILDARGATGTVQ